MHRWNLIKSARLCSQSDFECHAGWSGHNAHIRVALVGDDLNGHSLALEQDYPSRGKHPPECWHSGMVEDRRKQHKHQKYCFNRSLGSKGKHGKEEEQVERAPATGGWRNRWWMETFGAAQIHGKAMLSSSSFLPQERLTCADQYDHEL